MKLKVRPELFQEAYHELKLIIKMNTAQVTYRTNPAAGTIEFLTEVILTRKQAKLLFMWKMTYM